LFHRLIGMLSKKWNAFLRKTYHQFAQYTWQTFTIISVFRL